MNLKNPILLFGMPRSGTTWLGKIFDSHPDTLYRHEPDSNGSLNTIPLFPSRREVDCYRVLVDDYVANLPGIHDEKISASLPIFRKCYYSPAALITRKILVLGGKAASRIVGSVSVPDMIHPHRHPQLRLVWKSIESLGRLGVLAEALPDARSIIILRHPCGYVASVLRGQKEHKFATGAIDSEDWQLFNILLGLAPARARGLTLSEVQSMTDAERLALKWALYYEHALHETEGLANVKTVRYEDYCEHPLDETRNAFAHCGLNWAEETARFIDRSTSNERSEYYSVFKNPHASAIRWKKELTKSQRDGIVNVVSQYSAGKWYDWDN